MKGGKIQNNNDNQRSPANRTRIRSIRGLKRNARTSKKTTGRPFYIWSSIKHKPLSKYNNTIQGRCCFNYIIGLPQKNGTPQPLWNYEDQIYRALMISAYLNSSPNNGPSVYTKEEKSIDNCQKMEYNPIAVIPNCQVSIGIDPSFGSSKFGIVATRFVNERTEVIEAEEFERPDFNDMINSSQ
jgi:hypothetical protein